ncbi:hypothetical protein DXG01_010890 [Tephrocybe rancida]|nr:hypothetical protein DXG01_010890 [Tephrocybe rancida]
MGIRHHADMGAHEKTPWAYLTPAQMYSALERKSKQVNHLKLRGLNMGRKLGVRNQKIAGWKRFVVALANGDIPRVQTIVRTGLRNGRSLYSMIEKLDKAAQRVYNPHGYEQSDYERAFLIWKLGGRAAANIAHRALGTPSINTTKEHIASSPLRTSPGVPTMREMADNLALCHPRRVPAEAGQQRPVLGMVMQVDEIKIQERLRWDPCSNMILGVCREHGHQCALEFRTIFQADTLLECLKSDLVHLASEATVIAGSVLSDDPLDYSAVPYVVSPSCKRETVAQQETLLRSASLALNESQIANDRCLYCLASDGDSRRRQALISICFSHDLAEDESIYALLSPLKLFNLKCGTDGLTADFDWKHVFKRFRNTLLRQKGFILDGVPITLSILRAFLSKHEIAASTLDSLLAPNDKQDVILMVKLLRCVSLISSNEPGERPTQQSSRQVLHLLGQLYNHILQAYMNVELALNDQLVHLSAAAHLVLALYHQDKGEFIPVQLYFDVMSMIKNVYFCVAKTQVDNPSGRFWLILLGTDGLKKVFGLVRTMISNDTNANQFQLSNRIGGAVQCADILAQHPEWGGDSRRLTVKPLPNDPDDISSKYDHLNPRSMTGNLLVSSVVLSGCWQAGRRCAESEIMAAGMATPFERMESQGGFDILCPFGSGKVVLVNGRVDGERDETDEERDTILTPNNPSNIDTLHLQASGSEDSDTDLEPDLDDIAGTAEIAEEKGKQEAWISLNLNNATSGSARDAKVHKASVLRMYLNPLAALNSKERLRRVRGYSQFMQSPNLPMIHESNEDMVVVQDPALTLVRCRAKVFLAIVEIQAINIGGVDVPSLSVERLPEPNVQITAQVMKMSLVDVNHQPDGADWEWLGNYEHKSSIKGASGRWFELIDPDVQKAARGRRAGKDTYTFKSSELQSSAALLHQRVSESNDLHQLPGVAQSDTFPYRAFDVHPTAKVELYKALDLGDEESEQNLEAEDTGNINEEEGEELDGSETELSSDEEDFQSHNAVDVDQSGRDVVPDDTHTAEPVTGHEVDDNTIVTFIATSVSTRGRKRKVRVFSEASMICAAVECDAQISEEDLLTCDAPGCTEVYHLSCMGLISKPAEEWFCDDICRENAGFHVCDGRKRRHKGN